MKSAGKASRILLSVQLLILVLMRMNALDLRTITVKEKGTQNQSQSQSLSQEEQATQTLEIDELEKQRMYGVMVSVKSFMKFLQSHVVCTTTIAC